ncbi:aminoacyl-tRNA deacylase [Lactococcus hircilactis]|uniref:Cys-tRNA(Pro)/Cys-tRNA(Cys) deacylase n=1 Tax=Lactococcus hircilactis TaxID=1494462 RepID=A0A7X2CZX8_9LACT|nr:aminoacyl-tRNA deacylase [Lactococcus hircilactis]MQW38706.1 aminoacyl-tRNA deacylase [Lactococcus hircilactis]
MAKKQKIKKTLVEQILDKANLPYLSLSLNALEEKTLPAGIERSDIYKTLALIGDKTGPIVGILPLTEHLSEKKLAKISGNKKISMIPQKELQKTTGYIHGANNPVGIWQNKKFPIYIDHLAKSRAFIIVSAGEVGRSVSINPIALAEFVHAQFVELREA